MLTLARIVATSPAMPLTARGPQLTLTPSPGT